MKRKRKETKKKIKSEIKDGVEKEKVKSIIDSFGELYKRNPEGYNFLRNFIKRAIAIKEMQREQKEDE